MLFEIFLQEEERWQMHTRHRVPPVAKHRVYSHLFIPLFLSELAGKKKPDAARQRPNLDVDHSRISSLPRWFHTRCKSHFIYLTININIMSYMKEVGGYFFYFFIWTSGWHYFLPINEHYKASKDKSLMYIIFYYIK